MKDIKYLKILFAIIIFITIFAVFGNQGLVKLYRLVRERDSIVSYNKSLMKENDRLKEEIERLKHDKSYIERVAREELGMIGMNESIFQFEE